jgi:hypothetical protein
MPTEIAPNPICPYCRVLLRKVPKRKSLCPHCKKRIHVCEKQDLLPGISLFKEADARAIRWLGTLGVTRSDFDLYRQSQLKRSGHTSSLSDLAWGIMNESLTRTRDREQLRQIYWNMARFLYEEGKDHLKLMQEAQKWALAGWQNAARDGAIHWERTRLEVITAGAASCDACQILDGVAFTIEEVLGQMPLPVKNCSHEPAKPGGPGWCRCCYGLKFVG